MPLSKEAIEKYKKIYKEVEGKEILDEEAREQGTRLINLFRVLFKISDKEYLKTEKSKCQRKKY